MAQFYPRMIQFGMVLRRADEPRSTDIVVGVMEVGSSWLVENPPTGVAGICISGASYPVEGKLKYTLLCLDMATISPNSPGQNIYICKFPERWDVYYCYTITVSQTQVCGGRSVAASLPHLASPMLLTDWPFPPRACAYTYIRCEGRIRWMASYPSLRAVDSSPHPTRSLRNAPSSPISVITGCENPLPHLGTSVPGPQLLVASSRRLPRISPLQIRDPPTPRTC